jgi:2-polyprenyl-3-methyl-5-hydroxy-6-metoxy-1,4-benzoquinol methylase
VLEPEIIDEPGLTPERLWPALRGLRRINFWSGSAGIVWRPIRELVRTEKLSRVRVLDVATGAGDVPLRLHAKGQRAGPRLELTGVDRNPVAIDYAQRESAARGADISFRTLDALADPLPDGFDVVMCSLFLHHLDDGQAGELLRRMAGAARHLVLVNDLRRSRPGWWVAWCGTRVLTRSDMVHADGPRSVAAAFTIAEVQALAQRSGLTGAEVRPRFPWRFLLKWRRQRLTND